ncbi:MAG: hypothetical protein MUF56_04940 [Solirubrobacteraceae bacterium]|nr:hypothetical protein [Solirubrobacteraceae bacterium]
MDDEVGAGLADRGDVVRVGLAGREVRRLLAGERAASASPAVRSAVSSPASAMPAGPSALRTASASARAGTSGPATTKVRRQPSAAWRRACASPWTTSFGITRANVRAPEG